LDAQVRASGFVYRLTAGRPAAVESSPSRAKFEKAGARGISGRSKRPETIQIMERNGLGPRPI